jgi:hypothetical protein
MQLEDVTEVTNSLIAAGFVESIPYCEEVTMADFPAISFEVNPAYSHQLKFAIQNRV